MLAARAIVGTATGLTNLPDYPVTTPAGLTGPVVNPSLDLKPAGTAIAVDVITDTAPTGSNRRRQSIPDCRDQYPVTLPADPVGRSQG